MATLRTFVLVVLIFLQDGIEGFRRPIGARCSLTTSHRRSITMKAENIALLRQAAFTRDVARRDVIDNIRQLESGKANKIDPTSVEGKWELVFSSIPGGAANGFLIGGFFDGYFSIKEIVNFFECSLTTNLGSFRGPPSVVTSTVLSVLFFSFAQLLTTSRNLISCFTAFYSS